MNKYLNIVLLYSSITEWLQTIQKMEIRGKSLLKSWDTTLLPNWQPPLIFVWFTSKSHEH